MSRTCERHLFRSRYRIETVGDAVNDASNGHEADYRCQGYRYQPGSCYRPILIESTHHLALGARPPPKRGAHRARLTMTHAEVTAVKSQ
jgi:hypothetical protein